MIWPSGAHTHCFIRLDRGGIFHAFLVWFFYLSLATHLHPFATVAGGIWTPYCTALLIDIPGESGSNKMAICSTHPSFYTIKQGGGIFHAFLV